MQLTINEKNLGNLWLKNEKREREALEYMEYACEKAVGRPRFASLHEARMALYFRWEDTCKIIRDRGGLLLIGGAA